MVVKRLSIATMLLVSTLGVSLLWGQEFPEDELVAEQVVVVGFRTGIINRGKIRQIYKHVRTVTAGYEVIRKPITREVSSLYTYLPHPVVEVEKRIPKTEWEIVREYRALPQVGVRASSGGSSSSSSRTRRTTRRR